MKNLFTSRADLVHMFNSLITHNEQVVWTLMMLLGCFCFLFKARKPQSPSIVIGMKRATRTFFKMFPFVFYGRKSHKGLERHEG